MITHNDKYIAKESLTFPLLVAVMFGVYVYASICTPKFGVVFFGLGVTVYAYKYIRHGRTTLIIDSEGITIKGINEHETNIVISVRKLLRQP